MCEKSCVGTCKALSYEEVEEIANFLKSKVDIKPRIGLICGTGLAAVVTLLSNPEVIPYEEIPNFPHVTVLGHEGKLVFGYLGPTPVVCMLASFHFFEGHPLWKVVLPVRVMRLLGVSTLVFSNAAGCLNSSYAVGDIMFIKDHINFINFGGLNPLQGKDEKIYGPRFVSMHNAYDSTILKVAKNTAKELRMKEIQVGVYACVGGPSFETVAELKALKLLGADAVGMSTVHEVIEARHCGIQCFAFSLITNKCPLEYGRKYTPDYEEILNVGKSMQVDVLRFIERFFANLAHEQIV